MSGNQRALYAYNHYVNKRGLPPPVAAGIVGNLFVESGFADDVLSFKRMGDSGTAGGAAQWRGPRLKGLASFAKQTGSTAVDLDTQLDYVLHEMKTGSDAGAAKAFKLLQNTSSPQQAARIFMKHYERPASDPNINHLSRRESFAAQLLGASPDDLAQGASFRPTASAVPGQAGTAPDGTPIMQAGAVQEVTDPDILKAFGVGQTPTNMPTAEDVVVPVQGSTLAPVTDPNIIGAFEERREYMADRPNPATIRSDPGRSMPAGGQFKSGFTSDIDEQIRVAAQSIYPNEPLEEAVKRFQLVDGEIVHQGDDGEWYRATIPNELKNALSFAGPALPIGAGTATGILTAPMALGTSGAGLPASMALTGGAAAAAETGRQALGDVMMGEASTNTLDPYSIVQESAVNALGQGIGAGIGHVATRGAVRDIDRMNRPQTLRQYQDAKQQGIDITPGEATGLPSMRAQQNLLANDFRTADQLSDFYSKRNTQVMSAWDGFLDGVSKAADGEDVARSVREAAKGVIDDAIQARQQAAAPLYKEAFSKTPPLTDELTGLLKRPVVKKAAAKAYELMENAGKDPKGVFAEDGTVRRAPSMEEWNFIKFGLDDLIEANKNTRTGKLTSEGRIYQGLKRELLDELDSLVPEYGKARKIFETGSETVENTLESAIKRMADVKDPDILRETRILFEPGMRSPNMIRKLGRSIRGKDPEAWQAVKRLYLHDEATRALRVTQTGEVVSPAGKIYKTFANEKVLGNIEAALDPAELESFKSLMKVYRTVAGSQERNSWTAFMTEMQKETRRNATPAWAKGLSNLNPAQMLRNIETWATERNLTKHAETVAELITSGDPAVMEKLKELRRLSPTSKRGMVLVGQLLAETSAFGVRSAFAPQNYDPNAQANQGRE